MPIHFFSTQYRFASSSQALEVLVKMYGNEAVSNITEFYMSRFATDPYLYGNFATWPIGDFPEDAMDRLEGTIDGRVYFALGDSHDEHIGIPFGAVRTGERAAIAIEECNADDSVCTSYEPVEAMYPPCPRPRPLAKMRKNKNNVP